jgi:ABC-2 type transport system permease protein
VNGGALRDLRVLPRVLAFELRKATAFRLGFVLQKLRRGVPRPAVMVLIYVAIFRSTSATHIRGYTLPDLVAYLVWSALLIKCLTDEQTLDVGEQIFDGYVTKYLVMPVSFPTLLWGRFAQHTLVQLASAIALYALGALLLPAHWPVPHSALALAQAATLLVLGAACYHVVHVIIGMLAFWLDVVWSLHNMFGFVANFVAGALVPIALMPASVQHVFSALFPYWTVFAPAELLIGRMGSADFVRGVAVLSLTLVALQLLSLFTWKRGLVRYAGSGA